MIIQAELRRKQSEYEGEACSVDKVIELPAQRFKQFSHALLADYDFIAENKNAIRHDEDARHCLLILDADGTDGFLVDPQGYNYARYSAFVPNARSLLTLDMGIDRSYLSPVEPWRNENRDEMLRVTLRVEGKPDYKQPRANKSSPTWWGCSKIYAVDRPFTAPLGAACLNSLWGCRDYVRGLGDLPAAPTAPVGLAHGAAEQRWAKVGEGRLSDGFPAGNGKAVRAAKDILIGG